MEQEDNAAHALNLAAVERTTNSSSDKNFSRDKGAISGNIQSLSSRSYDPVYLSVCIPPARIILCLSPHKPLLVHHLPFLDPRPSWSPGEPRPHRTPRTARHQGRRGDDRSQRRSGASTVVGVGKGRGYSASSSPCTNVQGNLSRKRGSGRVGKETTLEKNPEVPKKEKTTVEKILRSEKDHETQHSQQPQKEIREK